MRAAVLQSLHILVDGDREHPGLAGNAAADHQNDPELPDGVGETQDRGGDETWTGHRHRHRQKAVEGRGAQGGRHLQRTPADIGEGVLERLNHEGERVDHRADHQPGKGEGQGLAAQRLDEAADRTAGPQRHEQIEPQNGGGKHQRQGDDGFDHRLATKSGSRQPPGERSAHQQ